jgi:O-antigen biosynthesis protein
MKLSVIIVNYNARYFIDLCLQSVRRAINEIEAEVWVVDNCSSDGSVEMINQKHNWVQLICNTENVGFAKANNQAINLARGEFVLLLNPDTIVCEDTFAQCLLYLDENNYVGALGIRMIDGSGNFLRESKRGLPTPTTAIFRAVGLSYVFPRSSRFSRYYMGHLVNNRNAEVPILAGAYMMIRKTALDVAGNFDETFFMYGEDIDLSYRIDRAGFTNSYFGLSSIIHFKGESTSKVSEHYLDNFFGAMDIFYQKHFSRGSSVWVNKLIHWGIKTKKVLKKLLSHQSAAPIQLTLQKVILCGCNQTEKNKITQTFPSVSFVDESTTVETLKIPTGDCAVVFSSSLSYRNVVQWISANNNKAQYYFLSNDTSFMLGSPSKDFPGKVWLLKG